MKHIAAAIIFIACAGWIAASILLHCQGAHEMAGWDWAFGLGAAFALFKVLDSD